LFQAVADPGGGWQRGRLPPSPAKKRKERKEERKKRRKKGKEEEMKGLGEDNYGFSDLNSKKKIMA